MNRRGTIRAALAGAAAAVVAPVVAQAAASPDAELIAIAGRYVDLEARYNAAYKVPGLTIEMEEEIDERMAPVEAEMSDILDRITRTPAQTTAGLAAVARVLTAYLDPRDRDPEDESRNLCDRLTSRLVRDARRFA